MPIHPFVGLTFRMQIWPSRGCPVEWTLWPPSLRTQGVT